MGRATGKMGKRSMWESRVSLSTGCALMIGAWVLTFGFIGVGWSLNVIGLQAVGLALSALAAALTIMRDNQRTRRMLARPGEVVAPLRRRDH